jgi:uncharacterized membrane protein YdjX (TVP38/TMEM64 family)
VDATTAELVMTAAPRRSGWPLGRLLLGLGLLVTLVVVGRQAGGWVVAFRDWVADQGAWGPVVFILGYAAAVVACAPAVLLTLAAGAVFGLGPGVLYVFLAAVLGSSAAFFVSRYLARGALERRLLAQPRFAAVDRAVAKRGRRIVFLLRLSPVFPFVLLNYALGLTRIRFADYLLAAPGMLPATLLYVYYGTVGGAAAAGAGGAAPAKGPGGWAVLGLGLVATAAVTVLITRIARRALDEATGE